MSEINLAMLANAKIQQEILSALLKKRFRYRKQAEKNVRLLKRNWYALRTN